jgi:hypothetical protein
VYLYSFFNFGARWGWVVQATLRLLYPQKRPGNHRIEGWVGRSAWVQKILSPLGIDLWTVQPVASRCTMYTNPDPHSHTCTPTVCLYGMHRDNFTSTFTFTLSHIQYFIFHFSAYYCRVIFSSIESWALFYRNVFALFHLSMVIFVCNFLHLPHHQAC